MDRMNAPPASHLTVGEAARRLGVTVRTLHHYDALGVVVPSGRSEAGHRLYAPADLDRLGRVLTLRAMGFALADIPSLVDAAPPERRAALRGRLAALRADARRIGAVVRLVTRTLEDDMSTPATREDLAEIFGESFDDAQAEAEARFGGTAPWEESTRRTARYTREDWEAIKAEAEANGAAFAAARDAGAAADSPRALEAAEAHREHVDRWFFPCDRPFQARLADLYEADPRYAAAYEGDHPGLAAHVTAAPRANAAR